MDSDGGQQLQKAYEDVRQQVPPTRSQEGLVEIKLLPKKDYWDETMRLLSEKVEELCAKGVPYKDMAILVRSNKTIQDIADFFMLNHPEVKLVSDEAFRLDASFSVNLIIDAMQVIAHPDDLLCKAQLVKAFQKQILHNNLTDSELFIHQETIDDYLPNEFIHSIEELSSMPIIDLAERLFRIERRLIPSALPQGHVVPVAGADRGLAGGLRPLHGGLGGLLGGVEPISPEADAAARIGETEGIQRAAAGQDHGLPDPAAGLHQVDGVADPYGGFRQRLLHTYSLSAAVLRDK